MNDRQRPDGIDARHIHARAGAISGRWPMGLIALGLLLGAALAGAFGSDLRLSGQGDAVSMVVESPGRIRNGSFYETVVTIEAVQDVQDLALTLDRNLWHEITVNTLAPEPSEYHYRDGSFRLHYGRLAAGETLVVKIDAQINSGRRPSTNRGPISVADGDRVLATVNYAMQVLP